VKLPGRTERLRIIGAMSADRAWETTIAGTSPDARAAAEAVRALVRRLDPNAVEVVWPHQGTVGWGIGPKKMTEHYADLAVHPTHINLGFYRGALLRDPAGLLGGTGKAMRHMKLRSPGDADRPEISELLRAAHTERVEAIEHG
jgi:hypothetical protein